VSSQKPSTIIVRVQLHTTLQRDKDLGNNNAFELHVTDSSTIYNIIELLNINLSLEHLLLVVNGHLVDPTYELKENDEVHLIPAISGGKD